MSCINNVALERKPVYFILLVLLYCWDRLNFWSECQYMSLAKLLVPSHQRQVQQMNTCIHEYKITFCFGSPLQQPYWDSFHINGFWQITVWHRASDFTELLWSLSDCTGWSIWRLRRAAQEDSLCTKEIFHKHKVWATENPDRKPKINNFPLIQLCSIAASVPVHLLQDLSSSLHSCAPRHCQHPAGPPGSHSLGIFSRHDWVFLPWTQELSVWAG